MFGLCVFFFFKQKTAYEMRISDWSSDVCSSDLFRFESRPALVGRGEVEIAQINRALDLPGRLPAEENARGMGVDAVDRPGRSESFSRGQPFGKIERISHGHRSQCFPAAG